MLENYEETFNKEKSNKKRVPKTSITNPDWAKTF